MTGLTRTVAPITTPLSLDEVKQHLRVDTSDQDAIIAIYLQAATDYLDGEWGFLGRCIVTQTWRLTLDSFPAGGQIRIPLPPLQSVVSVSYDDIDGNPQTIDSGSYFVDTATEPGWIVPNGTTSWPTTLDAINAVRVDFVAGFAPDASSPPSYTANVPFNIKAAMLLMISSWMENREGFVDTRMNVMPLGADVLVRRHKFDKSMA